VPLVLFHSFLITKKRQQNDRIPLEDSDILVAVVQ